MEKEKEHFSVSGSSGIILSDDSQFLNADKVGHDLSRSIESYDTGSETGNSKQVVEKGPKKSTINSQFTTQICKNPATSCS